MSVNSSLKATKIIVQGKVFYRQTIPEFSRARKDTADIDILVILLLSMREVFPKNISFIGQFSLTLWLFKVLGIVQKFLVC